VRPTTAYRRLNNLIWRSRLPKAKIVLVDDETMPNCYGMTLDDQDFARPVIFMNMSGKRHRWAKTMIHEMLHIAEPELDHGVLFDGLVECYWRIARKKIKGLK
jgi:hypothetical protein